MVCLCIFLFNYSIYQRLDGSSKTKVGQQCWVWARTATQQYWDWWRVFDRFAVWWNVFCWRCCVTPRSGPTDLVNGSIEISAYSLCAVTCLAIILIDLGHRPWQTRNMDHTDTQLSRPPLLLLLLRLRYWITLCVGLCSGRRTTRR